VTVPFLRSVLTALLVLLLIETPLVAAYVALVRTGRDPVASMYRLADWQTAHPAVLPAAFAVVLALLLVRRWRRA
jgi:hypothetical protein